MNEEIKGGIAVATEVVAETAKHPVLTATLLPVAIGLAAGAAITVGIQKLKAKKAAKKATKAEETVEVVDVEVED